MDSSTAAVVRVCRKVWCVVVGLVVGVKGGRRDGSHLPAERSVRHSVSELQALVITPHFCFLCVVARLAVKLLLE